MMTSMCMKVFVKSLLGNHWELANLDRQLTQVSHLKQLVHFQTGIHPTTQKLIYNQRTLADISTLESVGIHDGATVQLVLQLGTGL